MPISKIPPTQSIQMARGVSWATTFNCSRQHYLSCRGVFFRSCLGNMTHPGRLVLQSWGGGRINTFWGKFSQKDIYFHISTWKTFKCTFMEKEIVFILCATSNHCFTINSVPKKGVGIYNMVAH